MAVAIEAIFNTGILLNLQQGDVDTRSVYERSKIDLFSIYGRDESTVINNTGD